MSVRKKVKATPVVASKSTPVSQYTDVDLMRRFNRLFLRVEATAMALGDTSQSEAMIASGLADEALVQHTIAKGELFAFVHDALLNSASAGTVINNERPYGGLGN